MNRLKPAAIKRPKQLNFNHTKQQKYGNKKVVVDGIKFDSIAESKYLPVARLYAQKHNLELRLQEKFVLLPAHKRNGKTVRAIKYVPDFTFWDGDQLVKVVDVKGMQTKDFKIKAKWFCYKYNCDLILAKYDSYTGLFAETIF